MNSDNIYHPISPSAKRHPKDLQIKVPSNGKLGEPFTSTPSPASTSSVSSRFETITHLPTPIINTNSFINYDTTTDSLRETFSQPRMISPPRIVSDYKLSRHHSLNEKGRRFVSNPERANTESPITPTTSPTSPSSSKWYSQRFVAPHLGIEFEFVDELGVGNFSNVILAEGEGKLVAIKIISIPADSKKHVSNFKSFVSRELNVLYHVSYHPCITSLVDYDITLDISNDDVCNFPKDEKEMTVSDQEYENVQVHNQQLIFLNYCPGGNLLHFLLSHKQANYLHDLQYWHLIKRIVCEVILTVAFLHNKNIIHRDIKLENILLLHDSIDQLTDTNPIVNISDFGLSKRLQHPDQLLDTRCGSQDYISPEVLLGAKYNGKLSDSWSIGVLIFSILENRLPFDLPPTTQSPGVSPSVLKRKRSKNSVAHRIATIDWDWHRVNTYLTNTDDLAMEIKKIITQLKSIVDLLLVRKDKRIDVVELIAKPEYAWIRHGVPDDVVEFSK
ncbi:uncharacterized protein SPAPADRAFT_61143 [Spathaspora passalidarum NRRL Y-27907]|uniref:Protein kinase domain-containing protein n=1 Tax=Spathaspora passalidarum (strain NRRL Y-27907 / 11-Y1) TaxID=619300 RepID=G3AP17_SPAPN|nr:uncharacterized protein SPAPADRAFT_61143 [Spathaspora passalidarum NRRL Y-27907]EGW32048.1 hypothetical protein SPAPADRAFT_61143 [Spathaspora passalidarum NRRL Y-27907]